MKPIDRPKAGLSRGFWLRQIHSWHWISSGLCLIALIFFTATGITLNHAADIEGGAQTREKQASVPPRLRNSYATASDEDKRPMPPALRAWAEQRFGITVPATDADWSSGGIYVAMPRPGGDAWINVDRETAVATLEITDRGWISYLNDLHKGRNTGATWKIFIDVFAGACFLFIITGLLLLQLHAKRRPATWPLVGAGLALPVLLAFFFLH